LDHHSSKGGRNDVYRRVREAISGKGIFVVVFLFFCFVFVFGKKGKK